MQAFDANDANFLTAAVRIEPGPLAQQSSMLTSVPQSLQCKAILRSELQVRSTFCSATWWPTPELSRFSELAENCTFQKFFFTLRNQQPYIFIDIGATNKDPKLFFQNFNFSLKYHHLKFCTFGSGRMAKTSSPTLQKPYF